MSVKNSLVWMFILLFLITSCDKVYGPYSVVPPVNTNINDTTVIRKVLLEDFTGHKCQGCPAAHAEAQALKNRFQDSMVIITIHAGYFSGYATAPFTYNFTTPEGTDIYNSLIPSTQPFPTGTVNRKMYGSNRIVDFPNWGAKVEELLAQPPQANIKITPTWNASTRVIGGTFLTTFMAPVSGNIALSVYYTEDSIVEWQTFPASVTVSNYLHRHVLRGALPAGGTWGSIIASSPLMGSTVTTIITGSPIATAIKPEHVSVVAVLFDNTTKELLHVEEQRLLK